MDIRYSRDWIGFLSDTLAIGTAAQERVAGIVFAQSQCPLQIPTSESKSELLSQTPILIWLVPNGA